MAFVQIMSAVVVSDNNSMEVDCTCSKISE